jgi:hypothetical protein
MKCFALVLATLLGATLPGWSQAPATGNPASAPKKKVSPLAEYAGQWVSAFEGKIWLRLQLELRGEQLTGALLHARHIEVNDNGELKSVSEEQSGGTVTDAAVNPDGLVLTVKDADTQETNRYMMRLVPPANDAAELKMIGEVMPPGRPKPKPWRLARSAAAPKPALAPR